MKNLTATIVSAFAILALSGISITAQDSAATSTHNREAAKGLDLHAVAEVFKGSDNLENFEHALNNPETGINNLDLNHNDQVDFVRVEEHVADNTHLVVLQVPLGEDDFQDVATIAVEREGGEIYNLQIQGDESLYGPNYYIVPSSAEAGAWGVVRRLFRPDNRPYVSPFNFRTLPRWWAGGRRPVALAIYRTRTVAFAGRRNFVATNTVRVRTVNRVNYHPRTSTIVIRKTDTTRTVRAAETPRAVIQTRTETTTRIKPATQTNTTRTNSRVVVPRRGRH
jgi:hypothetical protein